MKAVGVEVIDHGEEKVWHDYMLRGGPASAEGSSAWCGVAWRGVACGFDSRHGGFVCWEGPDPTLGVEQW